MLLVILCAPAGFAGPAATGRALPSIQRAAVTLDAEKRVYSLQEFAKNYKQRWSYGGPPSEAAAPPPAPTASPPSPPPAAEVKAPSPPPAAPVAPPSLSASQVKLVELQMAALLSTMNAQEALDYLVGPAKETAVDASTLSRCVAIVRQAAAAMPPEQRAIRKATSDLPPIGGTASASSAAAASSRTLSLFRKTKVVITLAVAIIYLAASIVPPTSLPISVQRLRSVVLLPFAIIKLALAKVAVGATSLLV